MIQNRGTVIGIVLVAVMAATIITVTVASLSNLQAVNAVESGRIMVHAEGGNSTSPLTAFVPQQVQVGVG